MLASPGLAKPNSIKLAKYLCIKDLLVLSIKVAFLVQSKMHLKWGTFQLI